MNECMNDRWMQAWLATWQPEVGAMQDLQPYTGNHQVTPCTIGLSQLNKKMTTWQPEVGAMQEVRAIIPSGLHLIPIDSCIHKARREDQRLMCIAVHWPTKQRRQSISQSQGWRPMTRACSSPLACKKKKMNRSSRRRRRRRRRRRGWWQALLQSCWGIYILTVRTLSVRWWCSWLQWRSMLSLQSCKTLSGICVSQYVGRVSQECCVHTLQLWAYMPGHQLFWTHQNSSIWLSHCQ